MLRRAPVLLLACLAALAEASSASADASASSHGSSRKHTGRCNASLGVIAWEAPGSPASVQAAAFDPSTMREGPVETLDTGELGAPLRFAGLTLEWTNAGQARSRPVTGAS